MSSLGKMALNAIVALGVLVPDLAIAAPFAAPARAGGRTDVVQTGGIVCDFNGCRDYRIRHRPRIFIEPPDYEDPYYEQPPVYVRPPIYRRRVFVEPPPPRRIYRPAPVYPSYGMISRDHIRWCLDRYRSYNPRSDMYLLRRGVYRHCISPYS